MTWMLSDEFHKLANVTTYRFLSITVHNDRENVMLVVHWKVEFNYKRSSGAAVER